jgi:hypothetical protein
MFIAPLIQFRFQLYQERNLIPLLIGHRIQMWETTGYKHHAPTALEDLDHSFLIGGVSLTDKRADI